MQTSFSLCIEEVLDKVERSPEQYPVIHRGVRRALIRRFPYGIFYLLKEETIVVVAVFHGSRDPKD
ncbi:MAG: type II toxin-antitoxin system RelE/ParE family toxin, partial [Chloroflexi bacterium]|nr:type II toxin-antitoxin system RelE/ParE family toxin [Chloroflexota bacterium]